MSNYSDNKLFEMNNPNIFNAYNETLKKYNVTKAQCSQNIINFINTKHIQDYYIKQIKHSNDMDYNKSVLYIIIISSIFDILSNKLIDIYQYKIASIIQLIITIILLIWSLYIEYTNSIYKQNLSIELRMYHNNIYNINQNMDTLCDNLNDFKTFLINDNKKINNNINDININLTTLNESMSNVTKNIISLKTNQDIILKKQDELKNDMGQMKNELKNDMGQIKNELKNDMGQMKNELKNDMGQMKNNMGQMKNELKNEIASLNVKLDILVNKLNYNNSKI